MLFLSALPIQLIYAADEAYIIAGVKELLKAMVISVLGISDKEIYADYIESPRRVRSKEGGEREFCYVR
jgi:hypothetical protein